MNTKKILLAALLSAAFGSARAHDSVGDADDDCLDLWACDPAKGTLTRNWDGSYTYRARRGWTGADTFTYTVSDGKTTTTATVTLNVPCGIGGWGSGSCWSRKM